MFSRCTLLLIFLLPAQSALASEDLRRAGLFSSPDFTNAGNEWVKVTDNGWISGYAHPKSGTTDQAAWITSPADGITRRVGLFIGPEFTAEGYRVSTITQLALNGWVGGFSQSPLSDGYSKEVPWLANGSTGVTYRAGFTGPEFTSSYNGVQLSTLKQVTSSGCAWGTANRYQGAAMAGKAVWLADGKKGSVFRAGLFTGAETTNTGDGSQDSDVWQLTESGWLNGWTFLYGSQSNGLAAWIAEAATGTTRRVGFFTGTEYVSSRGLQRSSMIKVTESGWMGGTSDRFSPNAFIGSVDAGTAAWVANASTGNTRRIGLYSGLRYTDKYDNEQMSQVRFITESGWLAGYSDLYRNGETTVGTAAWVADAVTATSRRVGLFESPEFSEDSQESCTVDYLTESGWVGGKANRYRPERGSAGYAAWVAETATGNTRRVGLTGAEFTSSYGYQESSLLGITESGWANGHSVDYRDQNGVPGDQSLGYAQWVANATTGTTRQLRLPGTEFVSSGGNYGGSISGLTEKGIVFGYSQRWQGASAAGTAVWMADAATGAITPAGLTGPDFTRAGDHYQESKITGWTQSGFVRGTSTRYSGNNARDETPWVADSSTGRTFRPGLSGGGYTSSDGYESSSISFLTEAGLAGGQSTKAGGSGSTAWVYDIRSGIRTTFDLSSGSLIQGITPQGIVYGTYRRGNGTRSFLWTEGLGTILLDEEHPATGIPGAQQGQYLGGITVTGQGLVVGQGVYYGNILSLVRPAPGLRVTGLTPLSGSKYRLTFFTDTARRLTAQTSSDLTEWQDLNTMDALPGSSSLELDAPASRSQQYWRLKAVP